MHKQNIYIGLSKNRVSRIFDDLSWLSPLIWPQLGGYGGYSYTCELSVLQRFFSILCQAFRSASKGHAAKGVRAFCKRLSDVMHAWRGCIKFQLYGCFVNTCWKLCFLITTLGCRLWGSKTFFFYLLLITNGCSYQVFPFQKSEACR